MSYTHLIFFLSKDKHIIDFDLVISKFNSSNTAILLRGICSLLDKAFRGLITSELSASVGLNESFATSRRDAYVLIKLFLFQQLQKQFPKLPIHLEIRPIIECPLKKQGLNSFPRSSFFIFTEIQSRFPFNPSAYFLLNLHLSFRNFVLLCILYFFTVFTV